MINGHVDDNLQPRVPLALIGGNGQASAVEAVVDTGFNGHLCVSVYAMHKIGLKFLRIEKFELGDGKIVKQKVFLGELIFDGQKLIVEVITSKSLDSLIGAALLVNKKLDIDYTKKRVQIKNSRRRKNKRTKAVSR
jgi:clan AA aspartic protease